MRESFGGAFMIKLVLVFIVIYVSFMAVAINYAKAFRVKNQVINILEQGQYSFDGSVARAVEINVGDYLDGVNYHINNVTCDNDADSKTIHNDVCVKRKCSNSGNDCYYTVTTFIHIDFPLFKINMNLPVRGETKTIVK